MKTLIERYQLIDGRIILRGQWTLENFQSFFEKMRLFPNSRYYGYIRETLSRLAGKLIQITTLNTGQLEFECSRDFNFRGLETLDLSTRLFIESRLYVKQD